MTGTGGECSFASADVRYHEDPDPKLGRAEALREAMLAYINDKKSDPWNRSRGRFPSSEGSFEMRGSGHAAEHPPVAGRLRTMPVLYAVAPDGEIRQLQTARTRRPRIKPGLMGNKPFPDLHSAHETIRDDDDDGE